MIYHVYKTDCYKASRVIMQSEWVKENYYIHRSSLYDDSSVKLSFFNIINIILSVKSKDAVVFHAQSSLPYLLLSIIINYILFKNSVFIYDIHDLHEYDKKSSLYSKFRYFFLFCIELIVFKMVKVQKITVSNGLSATLASKYNCIAPLVVYNCSINISDEINNMDQRVDNFLFFGTAGRFPTILLECFYKNKLRLDFYGRGIDYGWLNKIDSNYDKDVVSIYGEYHPSNLKFIDNYKVALNFSPYNTSLNFKYSLPNKLFQVIAAGTTLVVSENFFEMIELFSDMKYAVVSANEENFIEKVNDIVKNKTLIDAKNAIFKLAEIKQVSKNNYLCMVLK